jgi:hypothetical protein
MQKSDWYRDRAAESDRKAHATTKLATRDRHTIKDRDGWLEIAASIDDFLIANRFKLRWTFEILWKTRPRFGFR